MSTSTHSMWSSDELLQHLSSIIESSSKADNDNAVTNNAELEIRLELQRLFNFGGKHGDDELYRDLTRSFLNWTTRRLDDDLSFDNSSCLNSTRMSSSHDHNNISNNKSSNHRSLESNLDDDDDDDDDDEGYVSANDSSEMDDLIAEDMEEMYIDPINQVRKDQANISSSSSSNNDTDKRNGGNSAKHDSYRNLMKEFELMGKENEQPTPTTESIPSTHSAKPSESSPYRDSTEKVTGMKNVSSSFQKINIQSGQSSQSLPKEAENNPDPPSYQPKEAATSTSKQGLNNKDAFDFTNLPPDDSSDSSLLFSPHPSNDTTKSTIPNPFTGMEKSQFQFNIGFSGKKASKRESPRSRKTKSNKSVKKTQHQAKAPSNTPTVERSTGMDANYMYTNSQTNDLTPGISMASPQTMDVDTPITSPDARFTPTFNIGIGSSPRKSSLHAQTHRNRSSVKSKVTSPKPITRNKPKVSTPDVPKASQPPLFQQFDKKEAERKIVVEKVATIKEEAKTLYSLEKYIDCAQKFSEAISYLTKNFTWIPKPLKNPEESELLANLYWSRSAALMMVGAYNASASDCEKGIEHLRDYNPLAFNVEDDKTLMTYLRSDGGLTLMSKLSARICRAHVKMGNIEEAEQSIANTLRISEIAAMCHQKIQNFATQKGIQIPKELQRLSEKVLTQCRADATLHKSDLKRMKEHLAAINSAGGLLKDTESQSARKRSQAVFHRIEDILKIAPSNIEMQESKVLCLASMRKWTKLANYCETIACQNALKGGVYTGDLMKMHPYPGLNNSGQLPQTMSNESLTPMQVAEAVLWLPKRKIVPLYLRSLRIEERYNDAEFACRALKSLPPCDDPVWSPSHKREKKWNQWLVREQEKISETMTRKEEGDKHYVNGNYSKAAELYAATLSIDNECGEPFKHPWEYNTAGGRLHAVLHCNRAACLMALRKFDEASFECGAALKIYKKYMKAILRRARCYARLERYDDSVLEYNRWTGLVQEAIANPDARSDEECSFDRAADISGTDFAKVTQELNDVKAKKAAKEELERQEAENARRRANSAFDRRQNWYEQQKNGGPRRWDSFNGSSPKRDSNRTSSRTGSNFHRSQSYSGNSSNRNTNYGHTNRRNDVDKQSPGSNSVTCHYAVLQVNVTASQADIKKAYHKMALKYHPDKNPSTSAADIFRKVKLAYETLSDNHSRRLYDIERIRRRR